MRIHINSVGGRIGAFWWVNADMQPFMLGPLPFIRLGTCGWGKNANVLFEPLEPVFDSLTHE